MMRDVSVMDAIVAYSVLMPLAHFSVMQKAIHFQKLVS